MITDPDLTFASKRQVTQWNLTQRRQPLSQHSAPGHSTSPVPAQERAERLVTTEWRLRCRTRLDLRRCARRGQEPWARMVTAGCLAAGGASVSMAPPGWSGRPIWRLGLRPCRPRSMAARCRRPAATGARPSGPALKPLLLFRRACHAAIRAVDAPVTRQRPAHRMALLAFVDALAGVGRHDFRVLVGALRAGQRRLEFDRTHRLP